MTKKKSEQSEQKVAQKKEPKKVESEKKVSVPIEERPTVQIQKEEKKGVQVVGKTLSLSVDMTVPLTGILERLSVLLEANIDLIRSKFVTVPQDIPQVDGPEVAMLGGRMNRIEEKISGIETRLQGIITWINTADTNKSKQGDQDITQDIIKEIRFLSGRFDLFQERLIKIEEWRGKAGDIFPSIAIPSKSESEPSITKVESLGSSAELSATTNGEKKRRRRRTKAEIEAEEKSESEISKVTGQPETPEPLKTVPSTITGEDDDFWKV